jgi:hypothetical protein
MMMSQTNPHAEYYLAKAREIYERALEERQKFYRARDEQRKYLNLVAFCANSAMERAARELKNLAYVVHHWGGDAQQVLEWREEIIMKNRKMMRQVLREYVAEVQSQLEPGSRIDLDLESAPRDVVQ